MSSDAVLLVDATQVGANFDATPATNANNRGFAALFYNILWYAAGTEPKKYFALEQQFSSTVRRSKGIILAYSTVQQAISRKSANALCRRRAVGRVRSM